MRPWSPKASPAAPRSATPQPFNLILCENLHGAAEIFRDLVLSHLPADLHPFVAEHIGFVDTVIARMVPPLTPELRAEDPSLILVEPYKELPVDRDAFVGPIPADRRHDSRTRRSRSSPSASSTSTTPGMRRWATWAI